MSTERMRQVLIKSGVEEKAVQEMPREQLMKEVIELYLLEEEIEEGQGAVGREVKEKITEKSPTPTPMTRPTAC